jgi:pimeloyl-ACP methyl ester carboxylesterase
MGISTRFHPVEIFDQGLYLPLERLGFRRCQVVTPQGRLSLQQYRGQGPGPTLVFLHGLSANAPEMSPVYVPLRHRASRILALDLPGHGRSQAPRDGMNGGALFEMLVSALDKLLDPAEPAILIGNSLGGLAAIRYALHSPERVKGLLLSSPGGASMPEEVFRPFVERFRNRQREAARDFVQDIFGHPLPRLLHWSTTEIARHRFGRANIQAMLDQLHINDLLTPDDLARLQTPTWIVWGGVDLIQPGQLEFFREHAPSHVRFDEPAHFSHCPFLEYPKEFRELIERFVDELKNVPESAFTSVEGR